MKWLARAEAKFGHLAIPHLLHAVVTLSALVFVLYKLQPDYIQLLDLDPARVQQGEVWRLVTYIFIPRFGGIFGDVIGAIFYLLIQWWIANGLETAMGPFRLNLYFLAGMIGTTVAAFFFGASFSNFALTSSLFFAFARFYPDEVMYVMWVLPMRVKWLAWISAFFLLVQFVTGGGDMRAGLLAAFANYVLFFGAESFREAQLHAQTMRRRRRFETAMAGADDSMHRCAVCGRTEQVAPDLEFRVAKDGQEYCTEHLPKKPATS